MSKLLIVEDNAESRYMLEQLLASNGHHITSAENGEEALELARRDSPEVIISDIMMPVMNGFRLCREIKNIPELRKIPFVFYTATFVEKEDEQLAMSLGASRFVIKPTDGDAFLRILNEVLEEHRLGILPVLEKPRDDENTLLKMSDSSLTRKLAETVEKLQAEHKALRESERKLKEAQEVAQMGHWELNLITNSLQWSDEIYRIFGLKPNEFHPTHEAFLNIVHPDDRAVVDQIYQDSLVKKMQYINDYRLELEGGAVKYVHERCQTIFDDQGQATSLIGTIQDVTDRKREELEKKELERHLIQAQKLEALGTLAGGIAHDFNNLLTAILGYGEMVLEELPKGSIQQQDQQQVILAGNRAKELVKQILAFSRHGETKLQPVQPYLIVREVTSLLRASIPSSIEIKKNIQKAGAVLCDPGQLQQIMMNLCTNAYQAMPEQNGVLSISIAPIEISKEEAKVISFDLLPGKFVKIEVSDTGRGIPADVIGRIFDPYFSTKKKDEGTGLGLAMVHGIVNNYGGHITVFSEVDIGTTFNIYLPRIDAEKNTEEIKPVSLLPRGDEKILVVDDQKEIVMMVEHMLKQQGYKVTIFTNSEEAFAAFKQNPENYDLLLTDMTMPFMTGIDLTQKVLAVRKDMPIILATGYSELISEEKSKNIGIAKYIMKPFLKKDIALAVREVLDKCKL